MSKASHSDELVARINRPKLVCYSFRYPSEWIGAEREESLCALIKGIGDYLMRVVGSVPPGLGITFETGQKRVSYYYDKALVQ